MDEEKLIQVSFQIPPSALDSLSRLAEQLRILAEAAGSQPISGSRVAEAEQGKSGSFDPERFLALQQSTGTTPKTVKTGFSEIGNARAASATISQSEDAGAVSNEVQKQLQDAKGAGDILHTYAERTIDADISGTHIPAGQPDIIPSVQAKAEGPVPDAPEASGNAERQIPDVENARAKAEERELALAAVQGEVSGGVETPLGAGIIIQTQPETPQSRWTGVTEELVIPGPAPLTAEAVSLAFERDGRRYDNGFPLY